LTLICGVGDHDVKLSEIAGDVLLTLGDGNQIVGIDDSTNNLAVTLGTGVHDLRISGTTGNINVTSLGDGEEFILVQNSASDVSITTTSMTATSNYTIQNTTGNVTVNTQGGLSNAFDIQNTLQGNVVLTSLDGPTGVLVKNTATDVTLNLGNGVHTVQVEDTGGSLQSSRGQGTHNYDIRKTSGDVSVTAQGESIKILDVKTNATQTVMNVLDTTTGDLIVSDHAFDIENTLQRYVFLTSSDTDTDIDIFNTTGNVVIQAGLYQEVDVFVLETGGVSIAEENDTFIIEFDQTIGELAVTQSQKVSFTSWDVPTHSHLQAIG